MKTIKIQKMAAILGAVGLVFSQIVSIGFAANEPVIPVHAAVTAPEIPVGETVAKQTPPVKVVQPSTTVDTLMQNGGIAQEAPLVSPGLPHGWTRAASNSNYAFRAVIEGNHGILYLRNLVTGTQQVLLNVVGSSKQPPQIASVFDVAADGKSCVYSANGVTYIKDLVEDHSVTLTGTPQNIRYFSDSGTPIVAVQIHAQEEQYVNLATFKQISMLHQIQVLPGTLPVSRATVDDFMALLASLKITQITRADVLALIPALGANQTFTGSFLISRSPSGQVAVAVSGHIDTNACYTAYGSITECTTVNMTYYSKVLYKPTKSQSFIYQNAGLYNGSIPGLGFTSEGYLLINPEYGSYAKLYDRNGQLISYGQYVSAAIR